MPAHTLQNSSKPALTKPQNPTKKNLKTYSTQPVFVFENLLPLKMALTQVSLLSLTLSLFLLFSTSTSSIQNLLRSQGLPGGLFPDNVKSYSVDESGLLEVYLEGPCMARFETRVYFDTVVRANLTYGGLEGLEGLSQEELFLWFPVKGIMVNDPSSGLILFDIGLAHKQLSLSLFEEPPVCKPQGTLLGNFGRKMGLDVLI